MAAVEFFLFDGDCAFCSACARFIGRRIPTSARIQPWQFVDLGVLGLTAGECDEAVQWVAVDEFGRREAASGPAALAVLLRNSTWWWRVAGLLLGTRPGLAIGWPVYRWVARHRERMPGGTAECAVSASGQPADRGNSE